MPAHLCVAILLAAVALSHILRPSEWTRFFLSVFRLPDAGLVLGMPTLLAGLAILFASPVWSLRPAVAAPIVGAAWTIKGILYLAFPGLPARVARPHLHHPRRFVGAGLALLVLAAVVAADGLVPE